MPYFTVCIPTYNRAHTIIRTLESLENQNYGNFEILIIDDGSTDNTGELISDYISKSKRMIRYFYKQNGGKHTALNYGISEAKGEFFIILDSDDILTQDALKDMEYLWNNSKINKEQFCGIMGKCVTLDGKPIGENFPEEGFISSYIDFHFGSGFSLKGNKYGDCCECIRTNILKKYRFPEDSSIKFVPESLILDKIGMKYNLLCTNRILKKVEYLQDGMTLNRTSHKENNIVGFIIKYVSNVDEIIPNSNISYLPKLVSWWQYWRAIKMDSTHSGPRCKKKTLMGMIVKYISPGLDLAYYLVKKK